MDLFHRNSRGKITPMGRECQFCSQVDPDFAKRTTIDRQVHPNLEDTASAHISEDGYVKHRIAELRKKRSASVSDDRLVKSA
jgi:hypothetical protein